MNYGELLYIRMTSGSMSPVENEAVVAAAISIHNATKAKQGGGIAVLEDWDGAFWRDKLPHSNIGQGQFIVSWQIFWDSHAQSIS